jgi:hypothetical protein
MQSIVAILVGRKVGAVVASILWNIWSWWIATLVVTGPVRAVVASGAGAKVATVAAYGVRQ